MVGVGKEYVVPLRFLFVCLPLFFHTSNVFTLRHVSSSSPSSVSLSLSHFFSVLTFSLSYFSLFFIPFRFLLLPVYSLTSTFDVYGGGGWDVGSRWVRLKVRVVPPRTRNILDRGGAERTPEPRVL